MFFKYLKYLLTHKFYVAIECFKQGLYWRGIVHDMSKFLPDEFVPYMRYFYGKYPTFAEIDADPCRGMPWAPEDLYAEKVALDFDMAWLKHQKRNKHHWQWWLLGKDDGDTIRFDIPDVYIKEMVCDWRGAGKAQGHGDDVLEWYQANKEKMRLSPITRREVEHILGIKK